MGSSRLIAAKGAGFNSRDASGLDFYAIHKTNDTLRIVYEDQESPEVAGSGDGGYLQPPIRTGASLEGQLSATYQTHPCLLYTSPSPRDS